MSTQQAPTQGYGRLEGWLVGNAQKGAELEVRWNDGERHSLPVAGRGRHGRILLPEPPGAGRHRLSITLRSPPWGGAVLDRVVVELTPP